MLNEWQEFWDYTGPVNYRAADKQDTTWLGRFTFEALRDFSGLSRILTILARGFLFHDGNGAVLPGEPRERIETARRGLCAWCSVPGQRKKNWHYQTDFASLHEEFPELVDADGIGWFLRHVLRTADFMLTHPENVRSTSLKYAEVIQSKFAAAWRSKVLQYQIPIFAPQTKGAWTLIRYYLANRQDDCEWVVLPVANFDAYFGDTSFSKKYLPKIPPEIMERSSAFGISRYRITEEYLP